MDTTPGQRFADILLELVNSATLGTGLTITRADAIAALVAVLDDPQWPGYQLLQ